MKPLIAIENLIVTFPRKEAVRGVSFSLHAGELLALVGESGSGKSMLCRSLLGQPPKGAKVSFDAFTRPAPGGMALVMQDAMTALDPAMPVGKQIAEANRAFPPEPAKLLARVGIERADLRARQYPGEFSGGMRQRAAIAVALAMRPKVIFADEPTTSLDGDMQIKIMRLLHEIRRDGTAILFVTHDLGLVRDFADRVLIMKEGLIIESGSASEIFENPQEDYTKELIRCAAIGNPSNHTHGKVHYHAMQLHSHSHAGPHAHESAADTKPARVGSAGHAHDKNYAYGKSCSHGQASESHEHSESYEHTQTGGGHTHSPAGQSAACAQNCKHGQAGESHEHSDGYEHTQTGVGHTHSPVGQSTASAQNCKHDQANKSHEHSKSCEHTQASAGHTHGPADENHKNAQPPIITLHDLSKSYSLGYRRSNHVLNHVSLAIYSGEIAGLCGPSGIGKSTLARCIAGLEKPSGGRRTMREGLRIQMIFQDSASALNPRMTVAQLIGEPLYLRDGKKPSPETILALMKDVELEQELYTRRPRELSGGQRQRVSIARSIATRPDLIIADEPVSSLDVTTRSKIIHLLKRLKDEYCLTMLLISHDLSLLAHVSDRIIEISPQNGVIEPVQ